MQFRVHGATDPGLVRRRNEDNFLVDADHQVFAVADGIGGMPGGDVASLTATQALRAEIARDPAGAVADLQALVQNAHEAVRRAGSRFGPEGIGTTLTLAHLSGAGVRVAHVGDSFALLVRGGRCRAITREHNVENERAEMFRLAPHPPAYRYALTRALGQPEAVAADIYEEDLREGDRLILATDGLTDVVEEAEIVRVCAEYPAPEETCAELISSALKRGGPDNITVIVILATA
jgi:protein phosphatase